MNGALGAIVSGPAPSARSAGSTGALRGLAPEWAGAEYGIPPGRVVRSVIADRGGSGAPNDDATVLCAGIVAHNEGDRIAAAIRSLLDSELPEATQWGSVWVVASGCVDGTVEVAQRIAEQDPRVRVLAEPERQGKSAAVHTILALAQGAPTILLNGDARARPDAVRKLWASVRDQRAPAAAMARPIPTAYPPGTLGVTLQVLWSLHHRHFLELARNGDLPLLSDELLLVRGCPPEALPRGIINDGAHLAAWISQRGGALQYVPEALVEITLPRSWGDHLRQRSRIHAGHAQIRARWGASPATFLARSVHHPGEGCRLLRACAREDTKSRTALPALLAGETVALGMAALHRVMGRTPVLWARASGFPPASESVRVRVASEDHGRPVGTPTDLRLSTLLRIAEEFGVEPDPEELAELLPPGAPEGAGELIDEIARRRARSRRTASGDRPEGRPANSDRPATGTSDRKSRGAAYLAAARKISEGHLAPLHPHIRFLGVTGSTAFGSPQPEDDLDFLLIVRPGSLWVTLAYIFLALRWKPLPTVEGSPVRPCFNYVLEEGAAIEEYSAGRGLSFAREALQVQGVRGDPFYRELLGAASWMKGELPRRYVRQSLPGPPKLSVPAHPLVRLANLVAYPLLASYLLLAGMYRNHEFRTRGELSREFSVRALPDRFALHSRRFDEIAARYVVEAAGTAPRLGASSTKAAPISAPSGFGSGAPGDSGEISG